jgi:hypothetical protein
MSSGDQVLTKETGTTRRGRKAKAGKKTRAAKKSGGPVQSSDPELAAPGSLTRTKALLLAALKVWELKHRIHD